MISTKSSPLMLTANSLTMALALSVSHKTICRIESADVPTLINELHAFPTASLFAIESFDFGGGEVTDVWGRLNSGSFRLFIVKAPAV